MVHEKLYEAARTNNVGTLNEMLQHDRQILFSVSIEPSDNPLHVAALFGHKDFAKAVMDQNPRLATERNDKGYYPIHLASSKGHLGIVEDLLDVDLYRGQCFQRDLEGRTPLQLAAIKGQMEVIRVLLTQCPWSAKAVTLKKETVLHLVVKYNLCEVMELLLLLLRDFGLLDEIVNYKDEDGNTVLHLAAAGKRGQMLKILSRNTNVNMNEVNESVLTALEAPVMEFKEKLESNDKSSDKAGKKNGASDTKKLLSGILVLNSLFATISFETLLDFSPDNADDMIRLRATGQVIPFSPYVATLCFVFSLATILFALILSSWKKLWLEFYAIVLFMTAYTVALAGCLFMVVYLVKTKNPDAIDALKYIPFTLTFCLILAILLIVLPGRCIVWFRKRH